MAAEVLLLKPRQEQQVEVVVAGLILVMVRYQLHPAVVLVCQLAEVAHRALLVLQLVLPELDLLEEEAREEAHRIAVQPEVRQQVDSLAERANQVILPLPQPVAVAVMEVQVVQVQLHRR